MYIAFKCNDMYRLVFVKHFLILWLCKCIFSHTKQNSTSKQFVEDNDIEKCLLVFNGINVSLVICFLDVA